MCSSFKLYLLLLVYMFVKKTYLVTADNQPYDVIKFKVPHSVWKQALHPTPVLKSPVTIVLPINVQDDDNLVDEDIEEDNAENVETDAILVNDEEVIPEVTPTIQDEVVNAAVDVANVTEIAVLQDEDNIQPPQQEVPGQVIRFPCSCRSGQCGCCTGTILERFRMKACGNMTFIPEDFVFDVRLSVNNNTVVQQRVSASDPPPICFNPRRAPFVRVCAEISNIRIRNRNAHACFDINADIGGFPVYSASFKCFSLGASGIKTGQKPKPLSSGPKPISLFGNGGEDEEGFVQSAVQTVLGQGDGIFGGGEGGILGGGNGGIFGGGGDGGGIFGGGGDGGSIFGGGEDGGIFGGGGDGAGDEGPLDAIGDAFGDFLDGRSYS